MALKSAVPFPLSPPLIFTPDRRRSSALTEIRFSRWNNANAEPFLRLRRHQKQIEDDIRHLRRFQSASKIADPPEWIKSSSSLASSPSFENKSQGTPSSPSLPSIPGKQSKYSKPEKHTPHMVIRSVRKAWVPPAEPDGETGISVSEKGVCYRIKNSPFEFQYSYTETPKVKPLALREPPFLPFGPTTMPRPWTGRPPLVKKKLPELGSFKSPPPRNNRPKRMATREDILGEPLTEEEIKELKNEGLKTNRQLNMGRDGLIHNMLDNIHAHWKRQKVCRIKCKGVCTVDMDNVRQQLEERTGGKIIWYRGGLIYLYRGRNYSYRSRPNLPLMLWKPMDPVYPRLVQLVPKGLTLEEATKMREKGRHLPSICKLGRNGVYFKLVSTVREAFEECELAKIDCEGIEKSDCRKIGAKLRDLVPCVLVSFQFEHILMWRGKEWKSSLPALTSDVKAAIDTSDSLVEGEEMTVKTSHDTDGNIVTAFVANSEHHKELQSPSSDVSKENCCLFIRPGSEEDDSLHFSQINCSSEDLAEGRVNHTPWLDDIMLLFNQAVEAGNAVVLNEEILDADAVLSKSVAFALKAS